MKIRTGLYWVSIFLLAISGACIRSNVYEKNVALPYHRWKQSFIPAYDFNIHDTVANYTMYLTMRHTDAYPYSNIWLNIKTTQPGETKPTNVKIEIPLAEANGKWLGRGMNEIWEHRMPLSINGQNIHFSQTGTYRIQLEQIMRVDPLPEVMSVGIRLEKNQ